MIGWLLRFGWSSTEWKRGIAVNPKAQRFSIRAPGLNGSNRCGVVVFDLGDFIRNSRKLSFAPGVFLSRLNKHAATVRPFRKLPNLIGMKRRTVGNLYPVLGRILHSVDS